MPLKLICPLIHHGIISYISHSALHAASSNGQLNIIQHLIEKEGFDPSSPDVFNNTPLHYAILFEHLPVVEYLLPLNQDTVCKDTLVHTPLHHGAHESYCFKSENST